MHCILKGYILPNTNKNDFAAAVSKQSEKVALLDLQDTTWLIPESVKLINDVCLEAVIMYTDNVLVERENHYPIQCGDTKYFYAL